MNFWVLYFYIAIVLYIYMLYCFIREKEKDKIIYIATIFAALFWPLTAVMMFCIVVSEERKRAKLKENKIKEVQEMINALEAKTLSQKNREEKISTMKEMMIIKITRNINIAVKIGKMGTTCRFQDENGIEEAINNGITILKESGFNVNYSTDWEFPTVAQAGQDPQGICFHILDISWDIEDEQDNS